MSGCIRDTKRCRGGGGGVRGGGLIMLAGGSMVVDLFVVARTAALFVVALRVDVVMLVVAMFVGVAMTVRFTMRATVRLVFDGPVLA